MIRSVERLPNCIHRMYLLLESKLPDHYKKVDQMKAVQITKKYQTFFSKICQKITAKNVFLCIGALMTRDFFIEILVSVKAAVKRHIVTREV